MADKEIILKEKVSQTGIFSFREFYSFAHSWFREEVYGVDEEKYSEKVSGNKRDIYIEWVATKRFSDYFRAEHKIKFEISNMTDVEVEVDSQRKKMNSGKVEVEIKTAMIRDPDSKWEKTPFLRFMRDTYNKYIIPSRVFDFRILFASDAQKFKESLKQFLELSARR